MKDHKLMELKDLHVLGRTNGELDPLTLFWHGSGIEMNVCASELWIEVNVDYDVFEQWIGIWIDGALISRHILVKGKYFVPVYMNGDAGVCRHVKVIKEVQPMQQDPAGLLQILSIRTDGSFLPVAAPSRKIEFIGDSMTSGEGTVGAKEEMAWNPMVMSASFAYPFLTSEKLGAECRILSQGGWGVFCGWDGVRQNNIPDHYEQVCSVLTGERNEMLGAGSAYDFTKWVPDDIVINLGTNDGNAFGAPSYYLDEKTGIIKVTDAVKEFLYNVRRDNPKAQIFWAVGSFPMTITPYIKSAVEEYTAESGDERCEALVFPTLSDETLGSRSHPGRKWHEQVAELLAERIGR